MTFKDFYKESAEKTTVYLDMSDLDSLKPSMKKHNVKYAGNYAFTGTQANLAKFIMGNWVDPADKKNYKWDELLKLVAGTEK